MFAMRSYHHPEEEWLLKYHAKFLLTWLVGTPYNNHSSSLMIFGYVDVVYWVCCSHIVVWYILAILML